MYATRSYWRIGLEPFTRGPREAHNARVNAPVAHHFVRPPLDAVALGMYATAWGLFALVLAGLHHPYMFTRGRPVKRSDLFYGCPHVVSDDCRTDPIPASRYDKDRVIKCPSHRVPMNEPMVKVPRR